jgi:hypothetical protein
MTFQVLPWTWSKGHAEIHFFICTYQYKNVTNQNVTFFYLNNHILRLKQSSRQIYDGLLFCPGTMNFVIIH